MGLVIAAFAAVYIIWGANYLAIRYAVETIPPFLMGGARFLFAGVMMYAILRLTGTPSPEGVHWKHAAIAGALMLGVGNGGLNWAQQRVPSSIAALLIAVTPLWFALLEWLRPKGTRPTVQTLAGLFVGFAGAALLATTKDNGQRSIVDPAGAAALMVASLCFACGSLYVRYAPRPRSAIMSGALQMITGGALLFGMGFLGGEAALFDSSKISTRSIYGFSFLLLIGSTLGYTSYTWLLKVSTPARVSTYAYVNPVVALILGCTIGGEILTSRMMLAAAIVVVSVIIILTPRRIAPASTQPAGLSDPSAVARECP